MKKLSKYFLMVVVLTGVFGVSYFASAQNSCNLRNLKQPTWEDFTPIEQGGFRELRIANNQQGCNGKGATVQIWENDMISGDGSDDFIKSFSITLPALNSTLPVDVQFTTADYAKGGSEPRFQEMYATIVLNPLDFDAGNIRSGNLRVNAVAEETDQDCPPTQTLENDVCVDNPALSSYKFLEPLGTDKYFDPAQKNALGSYLNLMLKIFIGICAVLAVVMIVMGGIEYMTSELVSSKEEGKSKITGALFGLLIALASYALLNTINPDLLKTDVKIDPTTISFAEGPEITVGDGVICGQTSTVNGQSVESCNASQLQTINFLGKSIEVNKAIVADLQAIDTAVKNSTDPKIKNYVVSTLGSYNPRAATNSNPPVASAHAFGVALDINSGANPYADSTTTCKTDMPAAFVKMFTDRGFGWGGYWTSKKDTMHFSKLSNEARYTSGTCDGLK